MEVDFPRGIVRWVKVPSTGFAESFFSQTYDRFFKSGEPVIETGLDALQEFVQANKCQPPSVFIFHVGRCGSTLIANGIRNATSGLVMAEAETINAVIASLLVNDFQPRGVTILKNLVLSYGNMGNTGSGHYAIKFSSWNVLVERQIRALFPTVPVILVFRDPLSVFKSFIRKPAAWMGFYGLPQIAEKIAGNQSNRFVDFLVGSLEQIFKCAAGIREDVLLIDHQSSHAENMRRILSFLRIAENEDMRIAIEENAKRYSKSVEPRLFNPIQSNVTINAEILDHIEHRINGFYHLLVAREKVQRHEFLRGPVS